MDFTKSLHALAEKIFTIQTDDQFQSAAMEVFQFQVKHNPVYREFINQLKFKESNIDSITKIPFLPVETFKHCKVITGDNDVKLVFKSSGTGNSMRSTHYITQPELYDYSILKGFNLFYGDPTDYIFLALLPNYIEQGDSSLIYMVNYLMNKSGNRGGFYLNNYEELINTTSVLKNSGKKMFLIGVSYALLDLAENYNINLENYFVMETGGMKGRKQELIRDALHEKLKRAFNVNQIHSEYSMTELKSQAYAVSDGKFKTPPWMKVLITDIQDPYTTLKRGETGSINIIDLANIDSCSFIATKDIGKFESDEHISILGRVDNSDIRGCNLLI